MKFYDLHVHLTFSNGKPDLKSLLERAEELGYAGICLVEYFQGKEKLKEIASIIENSKSCYDLEISLGFEARDELELRKLMKIRRDYDFLLVRGGKLKLNRLAVETPEVDILTHPEFERKDSGLDHIMAKLASKNKVAIELNIREILKSARETRARILRYMRRNVKLAKKYEAPLIICSGATNPWELKDPYLMAMVGCSLGLGMKEAKQALSKLPKSMIDFVKQRRTEKWLLPGVKLVERW